ncbi:MAG: bifunctional adenosylcobinamide kinase/adenosylcobinamide-phosphate guanylyltransferase [Chloroflexi bacterium]|nr:bifunctional adenosylcobinamide kinase/adenosylcobinamide-phosphate guanylyltransferase [Chloroflexota bacterium]
MGKRLTLILGGARSGKSDFAQALALKRGGGDVLFVATAQALDGEMIARIQNHRAARDAQWQTLEAPRAVARALRAAPPARLVLLDCVTFWVSNVLLADDRAADPSTAVDASPVAEQEMLNEADELIAWYRESEADLIVVSNEVGMGVVPPYELGRAYRDLLGAINRKIAAAADEVFWLVAGLPIEIKSRAIQLENL